VGIFAVQGGEDVKGNHVLLFGMTERAPVADPRSILNESLTDFPRDADRDEADDVVLQFPLQRTYFICGFCNRHFGSAYRNGSPGQPCPTCRSREIEAQYSWQ